MSEKRARAQNASEVGEYEDEEGDGDGEVKGGAISKSLKNLDALLDIDQGNIEPKDVAWESSHPA